MQEDPECGAALTTKSLPKRITNAADLRDGKIKNGTSQVEGQGTGKEQRGSWSRGVQERATSYNDRYIS